MTPKDIVANNGSTVQERENAGSGRLGKVPKMRPGNELQATQESAKHQKWGGKKERNPKPEFKRSGNEAESCEQSKNKQDFSLDSEGG